MKYVFGMFDDAASAAAATKRVEGHARVRQLAGPDKLRAFGLGSKEEGHFLEGMRRGSVVLCAETDDARADLVAREFQMEPTAPQMSTGYGAAAATGTGGIGTTATGGTGTTGTIRERAREKLSEVRADLKEKKEEIKEKIEARRGEKLAEERSIPIIEEKVEIGKRVVDRGAIRVITHVLTKPIDESVWLHEEEIEIERHAVRRDVRTGEVIDERTIEVRAKGEEPVVQKRAEVVEEVLLRKRDYDREAKIHDTVKRTEVEVQREQPRTSRPSSELRPSIR